MATLPVCACTDDDCRSSRKDDPSCRLGRCCCDEEAVELGTRNVVTATVPAPPPSVACLDVCPDCGALGWDHVVAFQCTARHDTCCSDAVHVHLGWTHPNDAPPQPPCTPIVLRTRRGRRVEGHVTTSVAGCGRALLARACTADPREQCCQRVLVHPYKGREGSKVAVVSSCEPSCVCVGLVRWWWAAMALAVFTVVYNAVEGGVSVWYGVEGGSVSLVGFGGDSVVEVLSACVVMWRLVSEATLPTGTRPATAPPHAEGQNQQSKGGCPCAAAADVPLRPRTPRTASHCKKERHAAAAIGVLLTILGVGAVVAAVIRLAVGSSPDSSLPGIIISTASLSFMVFLWRTKKSTAHRLNSATLERDAKCSLGCIHLSLVLLAGALAYRFLGVWWLDACAAVVLGLLIGRDGIRTLRLVLDPAFDGTVDACCG